MAQKSKISWTEATWNPLAGCSPISPGCKLCYAATMARRLAAMGQEKYQGTAERRGKVDVFTGHIALDESALQIPLRRKKPTIYFVNSMSDLFHEDVPDWFIDQCFAVMAICRQHTFQVLTKRANRMARYFRDRVWGDVIADLRSLHGLQAVGKPAGWLGQFLSAYACDDYFAGNSGAYFGEITGKLPFQAKMPQAWPLPNVCLGVSCEDQQRADERISHLLACPAAIRFVSAEPLLGPIDFEGWGDHAPTKVWVESLPATWSEFKWPDWVPADQRKHIEEFWGKSYGRSPKSWGQDHISQHVPATGSLLTFEMRGSGWADVNKMSATGIKGRYLHCWNNVGRVITEDGQCIPASGGIGAGWLSRWRTPGGDYRHKLNQIITGGESGSGARTHDLANSRAIGRQCAKAGIAWHHKQMGSNCVARWDDPAIVDLVTHGICSARSVQLGTDWHIREIDEDPLRGRIKFTHSKGGDPTEWPPEFRVQQLPEVPA